MISKFSYISVLTVVFCKCNNFHTFFKSKKHYPDPDPNQLGHSYHLINDLINNYWLFNKPNNLCFYQVSVTFLRQELCLVSNENSKKVSWFRKLSTKVHRKKSCFNKLTMSVERTYLSSQHTTGM